MDDLTDEQKLYIKEHPDLSVMETSRKFGCSPESICLCLRNTFGSDFYLGPRKRSRRVRVIIELYPFFSSSEIRNMTGISRTTAMTTAKKAGVKRTEETEKRLKQKRNDRLYSEEACRKRTSTLRKLFAGEKFRVESGLKQKTRLKIGRVPGRTLAKRHDLCKRFNYFYDVEYGNSYVVFYDSKTKRLPINEEKRCAEEYGLIFMRADED